MPEYERGDRKIHMPVTKPDIRIIGYPVLIIARSSTRLG